MLPACEQVREHCPPVGFFRLLPGMGIQVAMSRKLTLCMCGPSVDVILAFVALKSSQQLVCVRFVGATDGNDARKTTCLDRRRDQALELSVELAQLKVRYRLRSNLDATQRPLDDALINWD